MSSRQTRGGPHSTLSRLGALPPVITALLLAACQQHPDPHEAGDVVHEDDSHAAAAIDIRDPVIRRWYEITTGKLPEAPEPGSYGMNPDGSFTHPEETPATHEMMSFDGELDYWETESYASNMEVITFLPEVVTPWHTWQNIVDFDGRRYLYVYAYGGSELGIFDISDPANVKTLLRRWTPWTKDSNFRWFDDLPYDERVGAAAIQWNDELGTYIMVQSIEVMRFSVLEDKMREPDLVDEIRNAQHVKGFRVYAMRGPMPADWELLTKVTTDYEYPDAPIGEQRGSGSLDVPGWYGGKYMFIAAAPDDSYGLTEYPSFPYSAGQQAWDMSDPANPVFLDQWEVPGQIVGDPEHEAAYLANPRAGNRTSWMGARMPLFVPTEVEDGGKYGYAAMSANGFYVVDISDPRNMKTIGRLEFPPSVSGNEADNVNVSQVERTGIVYMNGYPMAEDCYEPYKEIYIIDVRDPANPKVAGTFPRPRPPAEAPYTDFCQRRGSFGPKRWGYHTQPGRSRQGVVPYAFYNAGVQVFDVQDAANPSIAAYFVPGYSPDTMPEFAQGNATYGIYVEYDRNIIWAFTSHGIYALSTPVLGEPLLGVPDEPWPPKQ